MIVVFPIQFPVWPEIGNIDLTFVSKNNIITQNSNQSKAISRVAVPLVFPGLVDQNLSQVKNDLLENIKLKQ